MDYQDSRDWRGRDGERERDYGWEETGNELEDYAEKRRTALKHANTLREERSNGYGPRDDEHEYTFRPVINRRPRYLDKNKNKQMAKLKMLMNNADPMERPLPASIKNLNLNHSSHQDFKQCGDYSPRFKHRFDHHHHPDRRQQERSKLSLRVDEPQPTYSSIRHQFENFDIDAADPSAQYFLNLRKSPDKRFIIAYIYRPCTKL